MDYPRKKSFAAELLKQRQKKRPNVILVVAVIVAIVAVGYILYSRYVALPGKAEITSIAVLPLDNLTGDPKQEYFTDGMHEALISNLSKISALRVISRTSVMQFRDTEKTIPEIARVLNVDALIEGSVFRADNTVRITVQLIGAFPERHLWNNTYDRDLEDVLALHSDVARAIADEIKIAVTPEEEAHLASARPVNTEAYDYYLRGNEYFHRGYEEEDFRVALQMYQKAVDLDTTFALAYANHSQTLLLI